MNKRYLSASVSFILYLLITSPSWGQDSALNTPYSFGGSCASQGAWTTNALSATQNLRRITLKLKNDANCTSLKANLETALTNLESTIQTTSDSDNKTARLSQIPAELSALRSFAANSPEEKQNILKLMMDRSVEGATLSAQVSQNDIGTNTNMMDFGSRVSRSTGMGVQILNQVVDDLPQLNECLMGDGAQALGAYLNATVKIAASFSSSGQNSIGSQLATTVSKLTNFARNQKFSKILRKLNQQEFLTSMSCLMELTSASYCEARDGMSLFKSGMKNLKFKAAKNNVNTATNPYTGYYILNTHVPNITKWMQKIQVGVDPKLPTDANFQNNINQEVTDFYKSVKTLLGNYNSKVITVKTLPTLEQKQNAVLNLLVSVSDRMLAGEGDSEHVNFFAMAMTSYKIPFFLIGMNNVPDQVSGKAMPQLSYRQWLQSNLSSIPAFKDPIALAETIRSNMSILVRSANIAAIEYFNRWYIVDKSALVNESLTDVNYTVKDSLNAIQEYLNLAKQRIITYKGDTSAIPIILDTQVRIKKILNAYAEIENLGLKWKNFKGLNIDPKEIQASAEMYEKLINIVYEQFNVMNSKSGFLANRMVNFVYKDYVMLIKNSVDFTPYQQDLFNAEGMGAFDRMLQLYNGNPANIQTDLNMALKINGGNLEALEMLLKDSMTGTIAELKMVSEGNASSSSEVFFSSIKRMFKDMKRDDQGHRVKAALWGPIRPQVYWFQHSDRYPLTSSTGSASSPDSEFSDAAAVKAQLCIQALAFNDQNSLMDLCHETVLKSPIEGSVDHDFSYDEILTNHLEDPTLSVQMQRALNHSDRVCAFRDYNRKTMVLYMGITNEQNQ